MAKRHFIKSYSTPSELVQLLRSRGLEIGNEKKAEHYLESIGYYRLSAYMYPSLKSPKHEHLRTFNDTKTLIDNEYRKSTEDFIQHFKDTYVEPYPPAWILGELLTMGESLNCFGRVFELDCEGASWCCNENWEKFMN